jgi:hypothetical protein
MKPLLAHDSFGYDPYNSADRHFAAKLALRRALHEGYAVLWMVFP